MKESEYNPSEEVTKKKKITHTWDLAESEYHPSEDLSCLFHSRTLGVMTSSVMCVSLPHPEIGI